MTIRIISALLGVIVLASGCVTTTPIERLPFPQEEYDELPETGTGVVKGQAFLRTRGGNVITSAGSRVYLNPLTTYSIQWYLAYLEDLEDPFNNVVLSDPDPRLMEYIRETIADASGSFRFENVPPGTYYLTTEVSWDAPTGSGFRPQGGILVREIRVEDDRETEVIISSR